MKNNTKATEQLLQFLVQDIRLCIGLQYVKKVFLLPLLQQLPQSPDYVVGLANIAGQSVPVIDLALQLGLERTETYSVQTPVILCSDGEREIAIIIDKIQEIGEAEEDNLQMTEEFSKPSSAFQGVVTINGELSLLINVQRIIDVVLSSSDSPFKVDKKVSSMIEKRDE